MPKDTGEVLRVARLLSASAPDTADRLRSIAAANFDDEYRPAIGGTSGAATPPIGCDFSQWDRFVERVGARIPLLEQDIEAMEKIGSGDSDQLESRVRADFFRYRDSTASKQLDLA